MQLTYKIIGLENIGKATREVQIAIAEELKKGLYASALKIEKEAKTSIAQGKHTGKIYKRGKITHQASAAGEPPASDTGRLVNSINSYPATQDMVASVIAGRGVVKYAVMLEFGTTKIKPRPFMFPAAEKSHDWIENRLADAVVKGVIKGSKK